MFLAQLLPLIDGKLQLEQIAAASRAMRLEQASRAQAGTDGSYEAMRLLQ